MPGPSSQSNSDVKTLIEAVNRQSEQISQLLTAVSSMMNSLSSIIPLLYKMTSQTLAPSYSTFTSSNLQPELIAYDAVRRVIQEDRTLLEEKSHNLVTVGIPEQEREEDTDQQDGQLLNSLVNELSIPSLTDALNQNCITHRRFGNKDTKKRILKIHLPSPSIRTEVLRSLRSRRPAVFRNFPHAYGREDLTREGLLLERDCKKVSKDRNEQAGAMELGVRGTRLIRFSHPRPLYNSSNNEGLQNVTIQQPSSPAIVSAPPPTPSRKNAKMTKTISSKQLSQAARSFN